MKLTFYGIDFSIELTLYGIDFSMEFETFCRSLTFSMELATYLTLHV